MLFLLSFLFYIHPVLSVQPIQPEPHVVLCTFYTESHKKLAEQWLLPSISDDFEVIVGTGKQYCQSATYYHDGWTKTTKNKVQFIIETIKNHSGDIVIFSDADITFFKPIKQEIIEFLQKNEFVIQIDSPGKLCSGFFALRANKKMLNLWEAIYAYMCTNEDISDQNALNHFVSPKKNVFKIVWDFLPATYFGGGTFKKSLWRPGDKLFIPENPAIFHANWTRFCYKIDMLMYVKKVINARKRIRK